MEDVAIIFNPYAGRGRAQSRILAVQNALEAAGLSFDLLLTEGRGHAIELARQARQAGHPLVVAAGGDGTVNEVVNGLAQAAGEGPVGPLGILPVGSANDFAESMGIDTDLHRAAQRLVRGYTRPADLGRVNDRYFDNNVGIGFEALVDIEAHKIKRLQGMPLYLIAVFRALVRFPFPVVDLEWDEGRMTRKRILLISVGNGWRVGGGFLITPDAQPDDGVLDLCIADALPRWQILRLLPKVMRGTHRDEPAVYLTRSTRLLIESADPLPAHADGEILWEDAHRIEITVEPGRLQVVV